MRTAIYRAYDQRSPEREYSPSSRVPAITIFLDRYAVESEKARADLRMHAGSREQNRRRLPRVAHAARALVRHRSAGIPTRLATMLTMRRFAWCAANASTVFVGQPTWSRSALAEVVIRPTA